MHVFWFYDIYIYIYTIMYIIIYTYHCCYYDHHHHHCFNINSDYSFVKIVTDMF